MIDINLLREQPDLFRSSLAARQMEPSPVEHVLAPG